MFRLTPALLLTILLTGCTSPIDYKKGLQDSSLCCEQLSAVQYTKLQYGKAESKHLGTEGDKARKFPEGKSFYMAVELPEYEGPFEIQIESVPTNNKVFIPRVTLLDKNYKTLKQISASSFVFNNGKAAHKFFVNEDKGYKYMMLYTAPDDIGKKGKQLKAGSRIVPIYTGAFVFYYRHGKDEDKTIESAEGGLLKVKALKYTLKKITADE